MTAMLDGTVDLSYNNRQALQAIAVVGILLSPIAFWLGYAAAEEAYRPDQI